MKEHLIRLYVILCLFITNSQYSHTQNNKPLADKYSGYLHMNDNRRITFQQLPRNFDYNGIRCILKDRKGFMWFGTEDGLIRFDGIRLYVYKYNADDTTSISHSTVNAIAEDKHGNIWIGTNNGLNLYNREKDNFIHIIEIAGELNNKYISALCFDEKSLLWMGTFGDGINVYDPVKQTFKRYSYIPDDQNAISANRITCIALDSSNNIWIGTHNGLNLYIDKIDGFRQFFADEINSNSLSSNNISSLTIDSEKNIWIGTKGGGINKLVEKNGTFLFERCQNITLSSNNVLSLEVDRSGYLWIGTENGGLDRLNISTGSVQSFQSEEGNNSSISGNSIWSLYSDNENRLWIGTYNKGVNVVDENFSKFKSYSKNIGNKRSLPDNDVRGFSEDNDGKIWIATDGGGICQFDPKTHKYERIINNSGDQRNITNDAVQYVIFDSNETLWIGTWGGGVDRLNKYGEKIKNYKIESESGGGNNCVFSLYEDSEGGIWVCTAGSGLFKYDQESDVFKQVSYSQQSTILNELAYIPVILQDHKGYFWIGTLNGIAVLKKSGNSNLTCYGFSRESNAPSLSSNSIVVIFEDSKNRLWFGTQDNGLNLFNEHDLTFTCIQKKHGLPGNCIRGILEDDEGFLWIMTESGLCRFDYETLSFTNYTREDGLNSNEFYRRSYLKSKNGEFYLGGENGFNVFNPMEIKSNPYIPELYLTNLKINNVSVDITHENPLLTSVIGETDKIRLNYKQNSFTLEFVALNYTRPLKNQYAYMLKGFDEDWNYNGNNRSATYTNMKPGKYIFMVKGSNNDGLWNTTPKQLQITIKPPLWKTWWAYCIYILSVMFITFISLRIWNERIRIKNELKLEKLAKEKEHELNEMHVQYFTNISHEFKTPLSLIIGPLDNMIDSSDLQLKEQLSIIKRNANRLLHLTNNLMNLRKLEEGGITLSVQYGNIVEDLNEIAGYFNIRLKRKQIDFSITSDAHDVYGWYDREILETIILNLLSNAVKYTPVKGNIGIETNCLKSEEITKHHHFFPDIDKPKSRYIEISISDNGLGIKSEEMPYIFDKFYQTKFGSKLKKTGTGIGLTLTKGLIELHHGQIRVNSKPEVKTVFTFVLPIDKHYYSEEEIMAEPTELLDKEIITSEYEFIQNPEEKETETEEEKEKPEILIIEDNDELRKYLTKELSTKFSITEAEDGKIGLDMGFSNIPDLVISDILMPQINGISLCKSLKSDIRTSHIPIILLTAKTSLRDQIEGTEIGADAYLTKPFNIQFLLAKINQLIQSRRNLYAHFSQNVYPMLNKITNNKLDQEFLQKTIDFIVINITDENMNVERLAAELNLSRSNVYRKIKALTGNTVVDFIKDIRLKQALKLMETKEYTLAEIAYLTGFTSPSYFTKCFRIKYGKPPSDYLRAEG